jgi:hypothetical protein
MPTSDNNNEATKEVVTQNTENAQLAKESETNAGMGNKSVIASANHAPVVNFPLPNNGMAADDKTLDALQNLARLMGNVPRQTGDGQKNWDVLGNSFRELACAVTASVQKHKETEANLVSFAKRQRLSTIRTFTDMSKIIATLCDKKAGHEFINFVNTEPSIIASAAVNNFCDVLQAPLQQICLNLDRVKRDSDRLHLSDLASKKEEVIPTTAPPVVPNGATETMASGTFTNWVDSLQYQTPEQAIESSASFENPRKRQRPPEKKEIAHPLGQMAALIDAQAAIGNVPMLYEN